jgi:hypothetical protein
MTKSSGSDGAEDNSKIPETKISLTGFGFPGEAFSLVLTNIFSEPDAHLNAVPPEGLPGVYEVTFVLEKPGVRGIPENEVKFAEFMEGSSHLAILAPAFPAPADAFKIQFAVKSDADSFVFEGFSDNAGYLAKLHVQPFEAKNRNAAEIRATKAAQSILSAYAANLDIPLQVGLIEVTEIATSNKSVTLTAPFFTAGSSAPVGTFDPEFANLAALYREALVSNTPAYRYLCLYKILEASRKRRERLGRKLKKEYRPIQLGEVIPATQAKQLEWLKAIFLGPREWKEPTLNQIFPSEVRGKKLTALFDGPMRQFRDRIAHGILDSGSYLHLDDLASTREITKWLPFLRCAVRRTLKNDFPEYYLPYLKEDGTVSYDYLLKETAG